VDLQNKIVVVGIVGFDASALNIWSQTDMPIGDQYLMGPSFTKDSKVCHVSVLSGVCYYCSSGAKPFVLLSFITGELNTLHVAFVMFTVCFYFRRN